MEQVKKKPFYKKVWFYFIVFLVLLGVGGLIHDNYRAANLQYKIEFHAFRDNSDIPGVKPNEATMLRYIVIFNQDFTKAEALAISDSLVKEHAEYQGKRIYSNEYTFLVDPSLDKDKGFKNEDKLRNAVYYDGKFNYYSDNFGVPVE